MSSIVPATSCSPRDIAPALTHALTNGARVAMVAGEDRPSEGVIEINYLLVSGIEPLFSEFTLQLDRSKPMLASMANLDFSIGRFERELADQFGVILVGHPRPARLVKHAHWPEDYHPLLHDAPPNLGTLPDRSDYPFLEVQGDAVYEIGVGPIHAGIIEPGHFRFSAVGESIIAMKARLWFVHRGIEKLFEGVGLPEAITLAEKISGDSSVGHSLAMTEAIEDALGIEIDPLTRLARQHLLNMEQMHNLISDIGAIANDVAFSIVNSFSSTQREYALRENRRLTGHRLLRGAIRLGGVAFREPPDPLFFERLAKEMDEIVEIFLSNVMAMDRLKGTGILSTIDARAIGCVGYVALASGIPNAEVVAPTIDTSRADNIVANTGYDPSQQTPGAASIGSGDVAARLEVRIFQLRSVLAELAQSALLLESFVTASVPISISSSTERATGVACLESWRGRLTHRIVVDHGRIIRAKVVDPSFFNWPAVSISLRGAMVADFPLINKSFNLSYAGNDL